MPDDTSGGGGRAGDGGESSTNFPPFSRFCRVCNKGFSSGKALGGHMRMHVQATKKVDDELCTNGGRRGNHVCFLCRKVFPSIKSLFGHMRSHPERNWKGIQPPETLNRQSSSSTLSDVDSSPAFKADDRSLDTAGTTTAPDVDLSKSLMCWPATAKRGRAASAALEDGLMEAACGLILLAAAAGTALNADQDSGRKKRKFAGKSYSFKLDSSAEAQGGCRNGENDSFRRKNDLGKENSGELDDEKPELERGMKRLKRKIAVTGEAKKTTAKQPEKRHLYRCCTCRITFSTPQALGGHRSGHNKGKAIDAIEAQAEATVKEEESEKERRIRDFDLNEPPSPREEEEEAEATKTMAIFMDR